MHITPYLVNLVSLSFQLLKCNYHVTCTHSSDYAIARCLSVCLSVTRQYSVDTTEHILKIIYHQVAPQHTIPYQTGWKYSDRNPT